MNSKFDEMMERLLGPKGVRPSGQTNASVGGELMDDDRTRTDASESRRSIQACILTTPDSLTS
ncbi:hypothetical protein [Burkholderia cepacia]|uniref:hypothetical protein n=1 Tax=Burkholderia cepacia TaxID=292 RepID=UPI002AB62AEA|nr:hypothetical protein [Burkholderia cepacia]